jgi:prepilin-type N-terminal cleavage/methylation domain-containing protein
VTPRSHSRGFSLIEVMIVVGIIATIAALAFSVLTSIRQRNATSMGPQQLAQALEYARDEAFATGRDTLFVLVGNAGPADAFRCLGRTSGGWDLATAGVTDANISRCVRYWIIQDNPGAPFDLNAFDPNNVPRRRDAATPQGDTVLAFDVLPGSLYLGRHPGYTPPNIPGASVFSSLNTMMAQDCSFCMTSTPVRGVIRFTARGEVRIGQPTSPPALAGGVIHLSAADGQGRPVPDTRVVAILAPRGLITTRIAATQ